MRSRLLSAPTDQDLVASVLSGDSDAFRLLFERHQPRLLTYLTAQTGDPFLAEDLAQDTFLTAYEHLPELAGDRLFAPWLFRIAHNRLHRVWRRRRLFHFLSLDHILSSASAGNLATRSTTDPSDACARIELVDQALAGLTADQRGVLLLHELAGFSVAEIAHITGRSPVATERMVSRARSRFRVRYHALDTR